MRQIYKCTVGDERATFNSRAEALDEGWVLAQVENKATLKYYALCPEHAGLDWIKKALAGADAKKGSK